MSVVSCRVLPSTYNGVFLSPKYSQFKQTRSIDDGRVVFKSDFSEVDVSEINKDFSSADFSLENLMALGAVTQLKEVSFSGDCKVDDLISEVSKMQEDFSHAQD